MNHTIVICYSVNRLGAIAEDAIITLVVAFVKFAVTGILANREFFRDQAIGFSKKLPIAND